MAAIFSPRVDSAVQANQGPTLGGGGPAGVTPANEVSLWRDKKKKGVTHRVIYIPLESESVIL